MMNCIYDLSANDRVGGSIRLSSLDATDLGFGRTFYQIVYNGFVHE